MTTTTGPVCIDDVVTVLAEYDPAQRWNGWLACPWLDAWSVVEVLDKLDADPSSDPDAGYDYDWDTETGALLLTDRMALAEGYDTPDVLHPDENGLYSLGAYGWVWSKDSDAELCWVCGGLNDHGDEPGHCRLDQGNGPSVPVCSVTCTDRFFAEGVEE